MDLVVMRLAGSWSIMVDGRKRGRFDYEVDAVDAAVRLAREARPGQGEVRVLVQDRFGELRPLDDVLNAGRSVTGGQAASPT